MNIAALPDLSPLSCRWAISTRRPNRLNVTQSTVTARLDVLEEGLGQKLLVRSRRGAELTKAGFVFLRHAELVTQAWDQARKAVGLPRGFSGMFSFACHFDLWDRAGSEWLERVRKDQSDLALEAWSGDLADLKRWLLSGLVDAALAPEPLSGAELTSAEIGQDRLVLVSTMPRAAMAWDPAYIYVDLGPEFRRQHSLTWPVEQTAHMTFGTSRWALDYLLEKGGSAYLPWRLAETYLGDGRLHAVAGAPEFSRPLHLHLEQGEPGGTPLARGCTIRAHRRSVCCNRLVRDGLRSPTPARRPHVAGIDPDRICRTDLRVHLRAEIVGIVRAHDRAHLIAAAFEEILRAFLLPLVGRRAVHECWIKRTRSP